LFTRLGGPKAHDIRQIISALPDIVTIRQAALLGTEDACKKNRKIN
jgi:hypothetical protein